MRSAAAEGGRLERAVRRQPPNKNELLYRAARGSERGPANATACEVGSSQGSESRTTLRKALWGGGAVGALAANGRTAQRGLAKHLAELNGRFTCDGLHGTIGVRAAND